MPTGAPDWRVADDYLSLLDIDCSGWAWEWLRRDPAYRTDVADRPADARAARWGLHAFEDPDKSAFHARPYWTREASLAVIDAAGDIMAECALDRTRASELVKWRAGPSGEQQVLIADDRSALRIDVADARASAPARAMMDLGERHRLLAQLAALHRFEAFRRTGCLMPSPLSRAKARRLVRLLRVADALAKGAAQREIAENLFDGTVAAPRWRIERPTVRLQVQRLVRQARVLGKGGHRLLLAGRW